MESKLTLTPEQIELCKRYNIPNDPGSSYYHFPSESFLEDGYAPLGGYVKDFCIFYHEGRYHLFHIDGRPQQRCIITGNEISFGHASTSDFIHWIRHKAPLAVTGDDWESEHIYAPYVFERNGRFYMYYMGYGNGKTYVTYASSDNLERWFHSNRPLIFAKGRDPFLFEDGERVVMVYTGMNGAQICAAETTDMERWTELPDVLFVKERATLESSSTHQLDAQRYILWFNDFLHTRDLSGDFRCCCAISDDRLRFSPEAVRPIKFISAHKSQISEDDWVEKGFVPIGVELVKKYEDYCVF